MTRPKMARAKRASKRNRRSNVPVLWAAGLSLSLAGAASASTGGPARDIAPSPSLVPGLPEFAAVGGEILPYHILRQTPLSVVSFIDTWPDMIRGFKDEATQAVFNGESSKGFPFDLLKVARRKLRYLNAAAELGDLRAPPGNRLEALKGDRAG